MSFVLAHIYFYNTCGEDKMDSLCTVKIQKPRHFLAGLLLRTNERYVNSYRGGRNRASTPKHCDEPVIDRSDIERLTANCLLCTVLGFLFYNYHYYLVI